MNMTRISSMNMKTCDDEGDGVDDDDDDGTDNGSLRRSTYRPYAPK